MPNVCVFYVSEQKLLLTANVLDYTWGKPFVFFHFWIVSWSLIKSCLYRLYFIWSHMECM